MRVGVWVVGGATGGWGGGAAIACETIFALTVEFGGASMGAFSAVAPLLLDPELVEACVDMGNR